MCDRKIKVQIIFSAQISHSCNKRKLNKEVENTRRKNRRLNNRIGEEKENVVIDITQTEQGIKILYLDQSIN